MTEQEVLLSLAKARVERIFSALKCPAGQWQVEEDKCNEGTYKVYTLEGAISGFDGNTKVWGTVCAGNYKVTVHSDGEESLEITIADGDYEHETADLDIRSGWYRKYEVSRMDGTDRPGGKHDGCSLFVLDLTHDPAARAAAKTYALEIAATNAQLSVELMQKIREAVWSTLLDFESFSSDDEEPLGFYVPGHLEGEVFAEELYRWLRDQYGHSDDTPESEIAEEQLEGADKLTVSICSRHRWVITGPEEDDGTHMLLFVEEKEEEAEPITVVYLDDLYKVVLAGKTRAEADDAQGDQALS